MSTALFDLTGRTALVTGSSGGLGLAIARGLGAAGAHVILNGRDAGRLEATQAGLAAAGIACSASVFDVGDEDGVRAAFAALDEAGVAVDILVNNAGIQFRRPLVELDTADWRRVIETNLTSAFVVGREAAHRMIARGQRGEAWAAR